MLLMTIPFLLLKDLFETSSCAKLKIMVSLASRAKTKPSQQWEMYSEEWDMVA